MEKKGGDRYGSQSRIDAKKKNPVRHFSVLQLKLIFPRKNKVAELAVDPVLRDTVNYKTAEIHHYAEIFRPPTGKLNYFTPGWSCVIQVGFRLKMNSCMKNLLVASGSMIEDIVSFQTTKCHQRVTIFRRPTGYSK